MHRNLIRLTDWSADDVAQVFALADAYEAGAGPGVEGCAVMFFPATSLRTRVTFERGAHLMGLQPMLFPPETLDKPEAPADVVGYLANWADVAVVRHRDITVLERLADAGTLPVVNAMTDANHPCEVLADVHALARTRDVRSLRFVFVGADGNIARTWTDDLDAAIRDADVVLTDGAGPNAKAPAPYQVTADLMSRARPGAVLNPCPPFTRGAEVSADAVTPGGPFVGYGFKASLLAVHQGVLAACLGLG
jgi:ornithine carbamoyltransferase